MAGNFETNVEIRDRKAAELGSKISRPRPPANFQPPTPVKSVAGGEFKRVPGFPKRIVGTPKERRAAALARVRENARYAAARRLVKRDEWGMPINAQRQRICGAPKKDGKPCMSTALKSDGRCKSHTKVVSELAGSRVDELPECAARHAEAPSIRSATQDERPEGSDKSDKADGSDGLDEGKGGNGELEL